MPRELRLALWAPVTVLLLGAPLWLVVQRLDLGTTEFGLNIYYFFFQRYEPMAWLGELVGLVVAAAALYHHAPPPFDTDRGRRLQTVWLWTGAAMLLAALWLGTVAIYHSYPLSMDEFGPAFQARIFLHGELAATIPERWRPYEAALTPVFVSCITGAHAWITAYLPVYSALHAVFLALGAASALNPLLGALSVVLVADVAHHLWPDQPNAGAVAVCLLVTSSQFLLNSISYYSMPAHLFANLLWLSLYLRNTRKSLAFLPWIGGLALGLHQIVVHALFAAPLLLRIARTRKLGTTMYIASVYLGFCGLWWWWRRISLVIGDADQVARVFGMPGIPQFLNQGINLTLLFSWQSAALGVLAVLGTFQWKRWSPALRDLGLGFVFSFGFYFFVLSQQGHGWGYRYAYGVLGNFVLIGVVGWLWLAEAIGRASAWRFLLASSVIALGLQVPFRAFQAERVIAPFAVARDYLASRNEDIIVLDPRIVWYGQDLVRNDPYFAAGKPALMNMLALPPDAPRTLSKLGSIHVLVPRELRALGLTVAERWLRNR